MEVYRNEGLQPWSEAKLPLQSDVPEGALVVREHTPMTNLFTCLWFNEVHRFTPRDQLSFGYVLHRLHHTFPFFMFLAVSTTRLWFCTSMSGSTHPSWNGPNGWTNSRTLQGPIIIVHLLLDIN